uniref:Uncharacterized protein n=1 Tax=Plectus sambesii TaxID=2011161 RepID=A0A914VT07_9BILA
METTGALARRRRQPTRRSPPPGAPCAGPGAPLALTYALETGTPRGPTSASFCPIGGGRCKAAERAAKAMAADSGRRRGADREEERLDTGRARIPDQGKQCAIFALFALSSARASFVSKLALKAVIVVARHKATASSSVRGSSAAETTTRPPPARVARGGRKGGQLVPSH